ncbi:MAG: hypothetical protein ACRETN_02145 [Nevskiales bacterium]
MTTYLTAYRHLNSLIGDQVFVLSGYEPNWDGPGGSLYEERIEGAGDVWRVGVRECNSRWRPKVADLLALRSAADVINLIADACCEDGGSVETESDFAARKSEERRRKLERAASDLARRYDVEPGSMAFIEACEAELERFSDYRRGMREDGLCIGYGVTYEQWSDEFNSSAGDSDAVYSILDWLADECPLLWAKYQEGKLAEAA